MSIPATAAADSAAGCVRVTYRPVEVWWSKAGDRRWYSAGIAAGVFGLIYRIGGGKQSRIVSDFGGEKGKVLREMTIMRRF